uniref:Large ribosomal subunit protein eL14 n=1 Tax=Lepeophtheirus salmonis TaxID=72036 RepID=D3PG31_LEPSM|nr:60S ribosomal protein L14 [Lepeophtheirus salmonis]
MPFKRFVEIGRVAVVTQGPFAGQIATIINVVDQNRVLLEGPGVPRHAYRIKNLHLTKLATKFPFNARSKVVKNAWEADKISEKWAECGWSKRMENRVKRVNLNDFDRFKLAKAKSVRNKIVARVFNIKKKKLTKTGKL